MKKYVSKITANTSLYEKLKSVVPDPANDLDTHESDIYVLKTPETGKIIKKYFDDMGIRDQSTVFIDNISNRPFYEVPFGYMNEFVEKRRIKSSTVSKKRCITASSSLTADEMWDYLLDMGVSEETLQVVTDINGYSEDTMRDILYAVSGYRDFDQVDDEFDDIESATVTSKYTKQEVIDAIMYAYGYNKTEANKYYKQADDSLKRELVEEYRGSTRKAFYND